MSTVGDSRRFARWLIGYLRPRWEHVESVGHLAEELSDRFGLPERVPMAARLHDVGYAPEIGTVGFYPLDGARFLAPEGLPKEVVCLVAWHTGAGSEAAERGLLNELDEFAQPDPIELDALTMIDLATGPDGSPVLDVARIAEILLSRYDEGHSVHEAVLKSGPHLLASSMRAKKRLGLPEDWPLCR